MKTEFHKRSVEHLKVKEPGKWHRQIKKLVGLTKKSPLLPNSDKSSAEIAEDLNSHFANICNELPRLDLTALPAFLPDVPPPIIDRIDVYNRIRQLNSSKAVHPSDIPVRLLKEFAYELSEPLTQLFNSCLRSYCFPDCWKIASVCPVPKTSPVSSYDQLRPISVTPILGRLFEGFLADWTMSDIKSKLDPRQFGNLKGSSVNHYLVSLLDEIHRGLDKSGNYANLVTVDFTKAFDLIDHTIAVRKLIDIGVSPSVVATICSFLSDRTQTLRYQGASSTPQQLTCGVPQGTKLGPIIFLVMVNDAASTTVNRWKYVDDLSLVEVLSKDQQSQMQQHMNTLTDWCRENSVTPKPQKCKVMQISFLRRDPPPPAVSINDTLLEVVSSLRLLGVTIQSNLKWDSQVQLMISRASRRLYILCCLRKNRVGVADLAFIYTMYIRPLLEFGVPVWSTSITIEQSLSIERVQRRALRMIVYPDRLHYEDTLQTLQIPKLSDRRIEILTKFGKSLLCSEQHRDILPPTRRELVPGRVLRNADDLHIPRLRTTRYKQSPVPSLVKLLNQ